MVRSRRQSDRTGINILMEIKWKKKLFIVGINSLFNLTWPCTCLSSRVVRIISAASSEDFNADIVFALDYSLSVSEEELKMEIDFIQHLSKSLNEDSRDSTAAVVLYGETAQTVIPFHPIGRGAFFDKLEELRTGGLRPKPAEMGRRMDAALIEAAKKLGASEKGTRDQHHLVILFTAGKQLYDKEREEDNDCLTSVYKQLSSQDIQIIVVPIGLEIDFKELGLIVKRPQSLFPVSSFDELNLNKAKATASYIEKTVGETFHSLR